MSGWSFACFSLSKSFRAIFWLTWKECLCHAILDDLWYFRFLSGTTGGWHVQQYTTTRPMKNQTYRASILFRAGRSESLSGSRQRCKVYQCPLLASRSGQQSGIYPRPGSLVLAPFYTQYRITLVRILTEGPGHLNFVAVILCRETKKGTTQSQMCTTCQPTQEVQ